MATARVGVGPSVRRATRADIDDVERLHRAAFPGDVAFSRTVLEYLLGHPASASFLAIADHAPVGFAGVVEDGNRIARLWTIHVKEAYRGIGVAGILLDDVLSVLEARGVHRLELQVWRGNDAAIQLYRRHGFEVTGREDAAFATYDPPGALTMALTIGSKS